MAFHVDRVFLQAHHDMLVLAGRPEPTVPLPGWQIELSDEIRGPGWVPIRDVQTVTFADGTEQLCIVLDYSVIEDAPFMEFSDLEGRTHDVRPP